MKKYYKIYLGLDIAFRPMWKKSYTFKGVEEYRSGDIVLVETRDGYTVGRVDKEVGQESIDFDIRKLRPIIGKVDAEAYIKTKRPRRKAPKWWDKLNDMEDDES